MKQNTSAFLRVGTLVLICLGVGTWAYLNGSPTTTPQDITSLEQKNSLNTKNATLENTNQFAHEQYIPGNKYTFYEKVTSTTPPNGTDCITPCAVTTFSCANGWNRFNLPGANYHSTVNWNCGWGTHTVDCQTICLKNMYWNGIKCIKRTPSACIEPTPSTPDGQCKSTYREFNISNGVKCSVGDPGVFAGEKKEITEICCDAGYTDNGNEECVKLYTGTWSCEGTTTAGQCSGKGGSCTNTTDPMIINSPYYHDINCLRLSASDCEKQYMTQIWCEDNSAHYKQATAIIDERNKNLIHEHYTIPGTERDCNFIARNNLYMIGANYDGMSHYCDFGRKANCTEASHFPICKLTKCSDLGSKNECNNWEFKGCTRKNGITTSTAVCSNGNCDPAKKPNCNTTYTGKWSCESTTTASTCEGETKNMKVDWNGSPFEWDDDPYGYEEDGYKREYEIRACAGDNCSCKPQTLYFIREINGIEKREKENIDRGYIPGSNYGADGECRENTENTTLMSNAYENIVCSDSQGEADCKKNKCTRKNGVTTTTAICSNGNCDPAKKPSCVSPIEVRLVIKVPIDPNTWLSNINLRSEFSNGWERFDNLTFYPTGSSDEYYIKLSDLIKYNRGENIDIGQLVLSQGSQRVFSGTTKSFVVSKNIKQKIQNINISWTQDPSN